MTPDPKALLREYHESGLTSLGHRHWSVSERTWREWMSPTNKRQPPRRVVDWIEGERRYDQGRLSAPQLVEPGSTQTRRPT